MENMKIYNAVRTPPEEALKTIGAGRLKGMTDINPMWRIKMLTEQFGPCGIGWKYVIVKEWTETASTGEIAAFVDILLYYKLDGEWSDGIPGTGGSSFCANEKAGMHMSDECYKMALTDAISVAAKALGFAADVYWERDQSKYTDPENVTHIQAAPQYVCSYCGKPIKGVKKQDGTTLTAQQIAEISKEKHGAVLCVKCMKDPNALRAAQ